eukprot:Em0118g11a
MASEHQSIAGHVQVINPHELARDLHADQQYFIIDCRPVLSYNSCHISGAINVYFTGMIKRRFLAGKISLTDLLKEEEKAKFQSSVGGATVVYDDSTGDMNDLSTSHPLVLVMRALMVMGWGTAICSEVTGWRVCGGRCVFEVWWRGVAEVEKDPIVPSPSSYYDRCNEPMPQQFVLKSLVPTARHKMTMPIQGVGESKSVPAVSPKVEGKMNPIASLQPCSVSAHTCFGPELVEFSAPPLSIGSVTDLTPGV